MVSMEISKYRNIIYTLQANVVTMLQKISNSRKLSVKLTMILEKDFNAFDIKFNVFDIYGKSHIIFILKESFCIA